MISNVSFSGREEMLMNVAKKAAEIKPVQKIAEKTTENYVCASMILPIQPKSAEKFISDFAPTGIKLDALA